MVGVRFNGFFQRALTEQSDTASVYSERMAFRITINHKTRVIALAPLLLIVIGLSLAWATNPNDLHGDWSTASRHSAGIAPDPAEHPEAIVQLYAARAFKWRGIFSVHTWIATKRKNADHYQIIQTLGWRAFRNRSVVDIRDDSPDRHWFNSPPRLVAERRGATAEQAIDRLHSAAKRYPHRDEYGLWPGPNSNSFIAHLLREVPELEMSMPPNAIGKDYLPGGRLIGPSPSGTGFQFSLAGALGLLVARDEGVELNLLGFSMGIDPSGPALLLPGIGRLGWN